MARVAIMLVEGQGASFDAVARLAARLDPIAVGSAVEGIVVVTAQTSMGPVALDRLVRGIGATVLAYGSLVYRSTELDVPRSGIPTEALRSLAEADPGFEVPGLGNVTTHLRGVSNRQE